MSNFEIFLLIALLLLANGVFAMTEIAVLSARKGRLKSLADQGDHRAQAALDLSESPNRFLSTIQVGITLIGVLAGAFTGATLTDQIAEAINKVPFLAPYSEAIGIGVVVLVITYLSLVIGELVPKRLALANPELIARFMARPMNSLSALASPLVTILSLSTDLVLKTFGIKATQDAQVTEDEVKTLVEEGVEAGVFHSGEPKMVESVLSLDELPVREIMTPRPRIIFLSRSDSSQGIWHKVVISAHSNFPVYDGDRDHVVGMVSVKALYAHLAVSNPVNLADLMTPPLLVPTTQTVTQLLDMFKKNGVHIALVMDEFGGVVGLVSLVDVIEAIVGDIPSLEERLKPTAKRREDGTWLIDGAMEIEELSRHMTEIKFPPDESRDYETVAGFVLERLGRMPQEGDTLEWQGIRFEVIDMDRQRVDKVLAAAAPPPSAPFQSA